LPAEDTDVGGVLFWPTPVASDSEGGGQAEGLGLMGPHDLSIWIGDEQCTAVTLVTVHTKVTCELPAITG